MFVLKTSRQDLNMGHVGSKTRSPGQILGNFCLHSIGHICDPILIRIFVLAISTLSSNMGHVRLTSMSPGQIFENSCLHSRGHTFDPILIKLGQNFCFGNI